ncbi:ricin-type beta-trefoil lectin domain protein [Clostridium botulinum C]|uniref:Main hemagglutinin protein n=3 Tax=Clostridium botulinum TaxID=1491 RepID=A0A9Q4TK41_CLOBO|nr:ricin-type beta-trefoil lectin domain protein [Clostridium botulinum C]NFD87558.1 main hemagglutinin protein [Clostridium botulinum]MCD3200194.1 ricin-type beta-trefoil lectin domain protein [Clostridium botulinum C]MCD3205739.1 ricin-type beta-trefoil lectin domain protein [Clostridium botulinum C]MCD3207426.1 ricin-type beta-trefoil lectin domain protein [Clostridium botulinum C]
MKDKNINMGGNNMSQTNANDLRNNEVFFISPSNNTNKVLDKISQSEVKLWNKLSGANQKWRLIYDTNKQAYKIKVMDNTSLILTWNAPLSSVSVKTDTNGDNQYWYLLQNYISRNVIIRNYMNPNLVLQYNIDDTLMVSTQTSSSNQFFKFSNCIYEALNNRNCKLQTQLNSDRFLSKNLNSQIIVLWQWFDSSRQKWIIEYNETKSAYTLKCQENNRYLTWIQNSNNYVETYQSTDSLIQYWNINYLDNDASKYILYNLQDTNRVLDVYNSQIANGTHVIVDSYHGNTNQQWIINLI